MVLAEIDGNTGWIIAICTGVGGLIGYISSFIIKLDNQRGSRRSRDNADAYESLLGLMDRVQTDNDKLQEELSRRQVAWTAAEIQVAKLISDNVHLWHIYEHKHKTLVAKGIETDELIQRPDYDQLTYAASAEMEFVTRTQRHNSDLLSKEIADTHKKVSDLSKKVRGE